MHKSYENTVITRTHQRKKHMSKSVYICIALENNNNVLRSKKSLRDTQRASWSSKILLPDSRSLFFGWIDSQWSVFNNFQIHKLTYRLHIVSEWKPVDREKSPSSTSYEQLWLLPLRNMPRNKSSPLMLYRAVKRVYLESVLLFTRLSMTPYIARETQHYVRLSDAIYRTGKAPHCDRLHIIGQQIMLMFQRDRLPIINYFYCV